MPIGIITRSGILPHHALIVHLAPMHPWLIEAPDHLVLTLRVQPGAKRTEVVGTHGDALKVRLAAPPVDGKANDVLIHFLAESFAVPTRNVTIMTGHTNRNKRVRVDMPAQRPDRLWR